MKQPQTERALFLLECLDLPEAAQVDDARWEDFQIDHLNDDSMFRIEDKARQIAWSFTVAAEAVANAVIGAESSVFVSINLDEAAEKIRYALSVYRNLYVAAHMPYVFRENIFRLEFSNGARIMSLPSTPPRGKAKMHVILDEFAHVQRDREIYIGGLPIISKGGKMRIGSSPMGARGVHWELSQQELQAYPGYTRVQTPWWKVRAFCEGEKPDQATVDRLSIGDLVEQYGNYRIQAIFENMALDDFAQEYCCIYVDELTSYFDWDLIRSNQDENLRCWHTKIADITQEATEMRTAISTGEIGKIMVAGVDIGRKRHLTEITVCETGGVKNPIRLMISLDKVDFEDQEKVLRQVVSLLPVRAMLIDQNGIGMHLAENMARNTRAEGVTFTNASKALWATELRIQLEKGNVPLPCDKDLAYQIHSVKKRVTAAKNVVYDTEANEKHHADRMWSLALAIWAAREHKHRPVWGSLPGS